MLKPRNIISIVLFVISLVVAVLMWHLLPDMIKAGSSTVNGVVSESYAHKGTVCFDVIFAPTIAGLAWHFLGNWNDARIAKNPKLSSYRLQGTLINIICFICSGAGVLLAVAIFAMN